MGIIKKVGVLIVIFLTLILFFLIIRVSFTGNVVLESQDDASVFNVKNYGAAGDGATDDTDSILATIDAARIYLETHDAATVYFPEGVYNVMPKGNVEREYNRTTKRIPGATLYQKSNDVWEEIGEFNLTGLSSLDQWYLGDYLPNASFGSNGERYIDRKSGRTYMMIDGLWVEQERLVEKIARREFNENGSFIDLDFTNGWSAAFMPPRVSDGSNGDYYIEYIVNLIEKSVFSLNQSYNGITFLGDGPKKSILSLRVWGDVDPMDYNVSSYEYNNSKGKKQTGKIIYSTRIPPKNSLGRYSRGHLFRMYSTIPSRSILFDEFHWKNLGMTGNTVASGRHAWYNGYDDLDAWDIFNKGIIIEGTSYNVSIENCELEGFRGETIYSGAGWKDTQVLIKDVEIHNSNANLISMGGPVTIINTTFYDAPGATENLAMGPKFTAIYNSTFDMNRNFPDRRMDWGIIYFGSPEGHMISEGNTFINIGFAGIFLSEWAHNVAVINNTFIDTGNAMYHIFLCQYCNSHNPWEPDFRGLNNISFSYNTIISENKSTRGFMYYGGTGGGGTSHNWQFTYNTLIGKNGKRVRGIVALQNKGPLEKMQNFSVANNVITNGNLYYRNTGDLSRIMRPLYYNNTFTVTNDPGAIETINLKLDHYFNPFTPNVSFNSLRNYEAPSYPTYPIDYPVVLGDVANYPVGFEFTAIVRGDSAIQGILFAPASWNSFDRQYLLVDDASITLKKGEDGIFDLVTYNPRTETVYLITQTSPSVNSRTRPTKEFLRVFGYHTLNLTPTIPIVFNDFSGVVEGDIITFYYNSNVGFANNGKIVTGTGDDWTPNHSGILTAQKINGVLQLNIVADDSICGNRIVEGYERCDFGVYNDGVSASSRRFQFVLPTGLEERLFYCNNYCFSSYEYVPVAQGNSDVLLMNASIDENDQIVSSSLFFPFHADFSPYVSSVTYSVAGMTQERTLFLTNNSFDGFLRVPSFDSHVLRFELHGDNASRTILIPMALFKSQFKTGSHFYGNLSTIGSDTCHFNLSIGNNTNADLSMDYADVRTVMLYCNDQPQMFFDWNFSRSKRMDLQELGLFKGLSERHYIFSRGLASIEPFSKSIILDIDTADARSQALCFADYEVDDIFDLSEGCNESGEYYVLLSRLPIMIDNYSIDFYNGNTSRVIISGLNHSVAAQTCVEYWQCFSSGWTDLNQCGTTRDIPSDSCLSQSSNADHEGGSGGGPSGGSFSSSNVNSNNLSINGSEDSSFVKELLDVLTPPGKLSSDNESEGVVIGESYFSSWLFILIVLVIDILLIVIIFTNYY